jgi:hypothetical protein
MSPYTSPLPTIISIPSWKPHSLCADLSWIQFMLQSLPNEIPLAPAAPVDLQWWGNASTSFGIGVIIGSYWAVWKWAPSFKVGLRQDFDIGWAKAVAVELGLWLTQPQHSWEWQAGRPHSASPVRQCRDCCSNKQRAVSQLGNQQNP